MISNIPFPWCFALEPSTRERKHIRALKFQEARRFVFKWHSVHKGKPDRRAAFVFWFSTGEPFSHLKRSPAAHAHTGCGEIFGTSQASSTVVTGSTEWPPLSVLGPNLLETQFRMSILNVNVNCHFKSHPLPISSFSLFNIQSNWSTQWHKSRMNCIKEDNSLFRVPSEFSVLLTYFLTFWGFLR